MVHPSQTGEKTNIVLKWLNISKASLSFSFSQVGAQFWRYIQNISKVDVSFNIAISVNYANVLTQVSKILKPEGLIWAIAFGNGEEIEWFLRAHEEKHIAGKGRGFLIIGEGFTYLNNLDPGDGILYTGGLYVLPSGFETARNRAEINYLGIVSMLQRIARTYISCGLVDSTVADLPAICLKAEFKAQNYNELDYLEADFGLFNAQNGKLVKICDIGTKIEVAEKQKIVYPGNVETKPQDVAPSIEFVYFGGHLNNPIPVDNAAEAVHIGGLSAYEEISNSNSILPNYSFQMNLVEIGGTRLNINEVEPFV